MNSTEQQFFNALEAKLWTAANKLLPSLDAAVYKHIVLGLLFIKYVSDAFEERQKELKTQFTNPAHDYYMNPAEYPGTFDEDLAAELEVRDYYTEKNVFWVPSEARWPLLVACAQLPPGAALPWYQPGKADAEKMRTVGWLIDTLLDSGRTLLISTHNLSLAAELGKRALILDEHGQLIYDGPLATALHDLDLLQAAGLAHRHRHRHGGTAHAHLHAHDWESS
jgi:hypothetical protein